MLKILIWMAKHLGAVFFILGTLGVIVGVIVLGIGKSPLFATLLIVIGLILWGVDAYFVSTTGFLSFALLIVVWEVTYIALYYIFIGISEPQKILWLYVSMISLAIFTKIGDTNIRTAASISLYLYGLSMLGAILILQTQDKVIGVGLLGKGIIYLGEFAKNQITGTKYLREIIEPILDAVASNQMLEYYIYVFIMLYWLAQDKATETIVKGEKLPRLLAAYTLVIFGLLIIVTGVFSTLHFISTERVIYQILSIGMGFLILLYGVSVIRGYRNQDVIETSDFA